MNKLVSIVIPCYNAEKYLHQCLDSIVSQTYPKLELVIVNDGSKDGSENILTKYANKYKWIKYINKDNGGASSARNVALNNISGEYVTFVDADDWIEPSHVENMVKSIEQGHDLAICLFKWEKRNNKNIKQPKNKIGKILNLEDTMTHMFVGKLFPGGYLPNKLLKVNLIKNLKFDETIHYGEDMLFLYNYLKRCSTTAIFNNNRTYHYIKTPNSIVRSKFNKKKLTILTCMEMMMADLESYNKNIWDYANGLYCQLNLEILYYLIRDKVKDKALKAKIKKQFRQSIPSLVKTKMFHRYRRTLVPVAYVLLRFMLGGLYER